MATVTKPLALDESINTTEQTPRNVADVLAEELQNIASAIGGGSGSGGHTIVNASGTDMTQRAKMQFVDAGVTDDSANNKTKVEVVQLIDDESDLDDAPDGVYQGDYDDIPEDVLDASMVAYGEGSVEDALDDIGDDLTNLSALKGCGFSVVNGTPLSNGFLALGLDYTKVPIAASVRNPYNTQIFISISHFVYDGGWYGFVEKYNSTSKVWETYTSQTAMSVLVFYKDLN